jgi:translation elongation factor EF-Tu-like GTPase
MKRKAIVKFLTKDEGGRSRSVLTGYKPHLLMINQQKTSVIITPSDPEQTELSLGTEHNVFVELQFEKEYGHYISDQMPINLYEGGHLVGVGRFV